MKYKYSAYDKNGKKITSFIEAVDIEEAKNLLKDYTLIDIKEVKNFSLNISFSSVSKKELAKFLNTLGLYLKSTIPLLNALSLTKNQVDNPKLIKLIDTLIRDIKEGKSFYSSLENQKIVKIPAYIINSIKVSEESGKLSIVLIEMSKFLKDEDKLSSKTTSALVYPSFIVLVAITLVSFMLTTVVPKIVKIFISLHQKLPKITQIVINSGHFLQHNYLKIIIIFVILVSVIVFMYKKIYKFKFFVHSIALKIPVIKQIIISKELGRFSYLTYTLTNSGVNFVNALNLSLNTIENEKIKSIFQKAINDVVEGKKFSVSLKKAGFFDKSFIQAIALAEETSEVSEILQNLSEIYFEENEERINIMLSLIEPMLIVIVGIAIGTIITAMLLPMFSMNVLK